jgi:hypothetical protein
MKEKELSKDPRVQAKRFIYQANDTGMDINITKGYALMLAKMDGRRKRSHYWNIVDRYIEIKCEEAMINYEIKNFGSNGYDLQGEGTEFWW